MTQIQAEENLKTEDTSERILATALDHFSKYGYLGASVREITSAAGVTKPTLYYYFRNKEELYCVLATSAFEKMLVPLSSPNHLHGNLKDNFCSFLKAYYDFAERDLSVARFVQMLSFTPRRDAPEVGIIEFKKKIDLLVEQMVTVALNKSEIADGLQVKVCLILQGLFALATERLLNGFKIPITDIDQTVEYLLTVP